MSKTFRKDVQGARRLIIDQSSPAPTIMAGGVGSVNASQYHISDSQKTSENETKPPYRIPMMPEIVAIPWNGLTVASTFSGCGGSCLGYRMAGYRVVWANEFVPSAQDSYRANMSPDCVLDCRDVKDVTAASILKATGIVKGELDLFDGSPPCQAFSMAGKRHKGWGEDKEYEGGGKQKNETMFSHYVRLLRGLMPRTFVAENVSGLVKGTAKGTFLEILKDLKESGYRVSVQVLDAQWLGVPQQRQRVIFVGTRNDLKINPTFPRPLSYFYSVREALPWVMECNTSAHGFTKENTLSLENSTPSVPASGAASYTGHRVIALLNVRIEQGAVYDESNRVNDVNEPAPTLKASGLGAGQRDQVSIVRRVRIARGFDAEEWVDADKTPYSTVGTSPAAGTNLNANGGKAEFETSDGIVERRKFTIAELRRICSFPDDFVLTGSYARQWERLGNSVPPVMMFWISRTIRDEVLFKIDGKKKWEHDPACLIAGLNVKKERTGPGKKKGGRKSLSPAPKFPKKRKR